MAGCGGTPRAVVAVLWLAGLVPAQSAEPTGRERYEVTDLFVDAGVEGAVVFDLAFEPGGVVWVAASSRLCRYDGYEWTHFSSDDGLPSDYVRSVCVTRAGAVWVGTDRGAASIENGRIGAVPAPLVDRSVRRIHEDRDGVLWFCCDRWPDRDRPGALVQLAAGAWRVHTPADGLPSDYVSSFHHAANGDRFALTRSGLARLEGDRWTRPLEAAGIAGARSYCWSAVDLPDGGMLVAADATWFRSDATGWSAIGTPREQVPRARLCALRNGDVVTIGEGPDSSLMRVSSGGLETISRVIGPPHASTEVLAQAPDGALWIAGARRLARLGLDAAQEWTELPGAPDPAFVDAAGWMWCADRDRTERRRGDAIEVVPDMTAPIAAAPGGGRVLGAAPSGLRVWEQGRTFAVSANELGIERVERIVFDGGGVAWCFGRAAGSKRWAFGDGVRWLHHEMPSHFARSKIRSVAPDPTAGVWCVLVDEPPDEAGSDGVSSLVRVDATGLHELELPAALRDFEPPRVRVDGTGRVWVFGLTGAYVLAADATAWTRFPTPGRTVADVRERPDGLWFLCIALTGGSGGLLRWSDAGGEFHPCAAAEWIGGDATGELFYGGPDGPYVLDSGAGARPHQIYRRTPRMRTAVRAPDGDLWFGSGGSAWRFRSDGRAPQTILVDAVDGIQVGEVASLRVRPRAWLRPRVAPQRFTVSYQVGSDPWSAWLDVTESGIPIAGLPVGRHVIRARVRDEGGDVDPSPAEWFLTVRPEPIQQRWWFWILVWVAVASMLGFAATAWFARRRLARHARELEFEVAERTREVLERERAYRRLFEQSNDAIYVTDASGVIVDANPAASAMFGRSREDLVSRAASSLFVEPASEPSLALAGDVERADGVDPSRFESLAHAVRTVESSDGQRIEVQLRASPRRDDAGRIVGCQVVLRDVTEQRELEVRLRHAHKMEAVGRLAGGIAHDFNNLLTVVIGNAELLAGTSRGAAEVRRGVDAILESSQRARMLTRQLQTFSRGQIAVARVVDVNVAAAALNHLLERTIGEHIVLTTKFDPEPSHVRIDPGQFDQVVVNLVLNARDAMPDGGNVEVSTTNVTLDAGQAHRLGLARSGPYVRLRVADDGIGMDAETRQRIFEPFFTTKGGDRGTGLGLSTVYGIVRQAHGAIAVVSAPGAGSDFDVYLPRTTADVDVKAGPVAPQHPARGEGEVVLVVEDEATIRAVLCRLLEDLGYRAIDVADGGEAVELLRSPATRIDVVLTDVVMPGMNGIRLALWILANRPDVRVVMMSGFSDFDPFHPELVDAGVGVLTKPITAAELHGAIRTALERSSQTAGRPSV